jgi:Glycyl-tRNA synthetase, beta subunit
LINILKIYKKTLILNKLISKDIGKDVMFSYKRSSNIIFNELKNNKIELIGSPDPGLFKNEFENALYKKIHEIRKNFTSIGRENDYESILKALSLVRKEVNDFFENVIVNDEEELIKKNRLELLQMLCKTFDNYLNFSKIESLS